MLVDWRAPGIERYTRDRLMQARGPLPAAAAVGHVNVSTEAEGVARQLLIRAADDSGRALRALAVEAVRIGDRIPEQAVTDTASAVLLGSRVIPIEQSAPSVVIGGAAQT